MSKTATYKALERGYVDGQIIEEGEVFTTAARKGKWMEPVDAKEYAAAKAEHDATPDDPNYDALTLPALQALASTDEFKIDFAPGGKALSKGDLLTAIKAKRKPTA